MSSCVPDNKHASRRSIELQALQYLLPPFHNLEQWRIQYFSDVGTTASKGGGGGGQGAGVAANYYFCHFSPENCMKLKVIGLRRGQGCVPNAPLRSANVETESRSRYILSFLDVIDKMPGLFSAPLLKSERSDLSSLQYCCNQACSLQWGQLAVKFEKKNHQLLKKSNPKCVPEDSK